MANNKKPDEKTSDSTFIISAPIIAQNFVKKNGQPTNHIEYFVERSMGNYFIKFYGGKITRDELEAALAKQSGPIKTLKIEVSFHHGLWDANDSDYEVQSRVGDYCLIYRIID